MLRAYFLYLIFHFFLLLVTMASASPLAMQEDDLKLLLAARTHLGNENVNAHMSKYVWRRRQEGGLCLNLRIEPFFPQ